ncbi:hypothetical protein TNCV_3728951 [Trichonephila clavipes]|nr:hypothetical protein TNCV_3728951 [Trichonephila clavipes]
MSGVQLASRLPSHSALFLRHLSLFVGGHSPFNVLQYHVLVVTNATCLTKSKKEDLRRIASELELCVSDKLTVLDLMDLLKNCDRYKNDPDSVHELANLIIEERKYYESQQLESSVVMSDMCIDDVLTGAETLLEAKELKNQPINIFAKGSMVLHKWCGNNTELIEVSENYDFSDSSEIKVLGV